MELASVQPDSLSKLPVGGFEDMVLILAHLLEPKPERKSKGASYLGKPFHLPRMAALM